MARKKPGIIYIILLLILVSSHMSLAQQEKITEYQIKAAFLYNFAKFVAWPDQAFAGENAPFTFEILGKDPFGLSIESLRAQKVGGRSIEILHAKEPDLLRPCQVLFISASERRNTDTVLKKLRGSPVLTVSDIPGFAGKGGIIEFTVENMQVRFLINLEAARSAGLRINYQLLSVAKEVIGK